MVNNPYQQRLNMMKEKETRDFNEVKQRFDKEKEFVDMQKDQAKQLNYQQLKMQRDEQGHIKKLSDT
jgi:hypothetical protein